MSVNSISDRKPWKLMVAMGLVLALMGCAGDGSRTLVTHVNQEPLWSPGLLHHLASSPQGLVMRVSAADGDARWAAEAAAVLGDIGWMPFSDLTIDRPGSHEPVFHIALAVHAPSTLSGDSACSGDMTPVIGHADVVIALCHGGRAIATARATASPPLMPDSPSFRQAVRAAAIGAFPRRSPDEPDFDPIILLPII